MDEYSTLTKKLKEMKNLISMVAFVLEQEEKLKYIYGTAKDPLEIDKARIDFICNVSNKANFLSRQPQLSDFVACGEDGLPIEEPNHVPISTATDEEWKQYCLDLKNYQQTLDKVLFKGWKVENKSKVTTWIESDKNESICFTDRGKVNYNGIDITTLESLTPYNLELTENANKIIGL